MTNTEQTSSGWRVTTTLPIYILLLHSENEYYNFVFLEVGTADCGCERVEIFGSEIETMQYIIDNNISKYIPNDIDNV